MMTFPVSLTLRSTDDGLRMCAYPVEEISKLHAKEYKWEDEDLAPDKNPLKDVKGNLFDIDAEIDLGDANEVGFEINGFPVTYKVKENLLIGGEGKEGNEFSAGETVATLKPIDGKIRLRMLVDRPSVEIYANDGLVYMPMQAVRNLNNKSLKVYAKGGSAHIQKLTVHELKRIWP